MTKAINWNAIEDFIDKKTYEQLTQQFWLSTRMPISKDIKDWSIMSKEEKTLVERVFVGLTLLDTLQSEIGVDSLKNAVRTQHETAVLNNIAFMESEHARSYSAIFSTLNTNQEIREIFQWSERHEALNEKAEIIENIYKNGTDLEKKIASVFLESFLFYSGFFTPLYFLGQGKMINTAEIINLIIRDESLHGAYIGHKFKLAYDELNKEEQFQIEQFAYNLLYKLYQNECVYTEYLYDNIGWTNEVKTFLRYNANKALHNLGLNSLFPDTIEDVNPIVVNGLSTTTTNHDFFSAVGNGYLLTEVEDMKDSDYNI